VGERGVGDLELGDIRLKWENNIKNDLREE
jgi:hypothetical protein